jgi:3-methyladenine DNA glycosylase AlkD
MRDQSFGPEAAALAVTEALRPLGTPERAAGSKEYLKSDLEFFGVTVPDMRRVVTSALRGYPDLDGEAVLDWAVALWREPVFERRIAAVELLQQAAARLSGEHLATVEELIRGSFTWALVDGLACNVAGAIALRDPGASWRRIDTWACDGNFWVRRSALLTLLPGIRCGKPDLTRFTRYAESMLAEKEFFIRKAIGWVLREIARRDPEFTVEWTENHIFEMSGVTFREAVRRLPVSEAERLTSLRGR